MAERIEARATDDTAARAGARCACGTESATMLRLGWRATGTGDVVELARCAACFVAVPIGVLADATICAGCHRVITGEDGDVKACVDKDGACQVLCAGCARRHYGVLMPRMHRWRPAI